MKLKKMILYSIFIGMMAAGLLSGYATKAQGRISEQMLRLHVLAQSDTYEDQQLKLAVRDSILEYLSDKMEDSASPAAAKEAVIRELDGIVRTARETVRQNGYDYEITAQVGEFEFPTRVYGMFSIPGGRYEALRILVGSGEGKNWWCVLYPNLCANPDAGEKLAANLSGEDYELVTKPSFKFRIVEIFSKK